MFLIYNLEMDAYFKMPRNVYLLCLAQIIGMSAVTLVFLVGGFISVRIAPSPTLATLPLGLSFLGLAVATIPAPLLMKKIGRKKGFIFAAIASAFVTLLSAFAVIQNNFYLFCFSIFLLGAHGAFVGQYRFASLESVPKQLAGKAVGLTLLSTVLAGVLGPEIAKRTKDIAPLEYAGSFFFLTGLFIMVAIILTFFKNIKEQALEVSGSERPLSEIIKQPVFFIAALAATVGYGVMVFIMSATPLQLHTVSHFSLENTAFVIQSHIVAMFLPSLFTGMLIQKFGMFKVLIAGLLALALAVFTSINAHSLYSYWVALVLLGIGWNFLFIGSTILLPQSYTAPERFKAQGVNDFIFVISQVTGSLSAGSVLFGAGWVNLNLFTLPFIILTFAIFLMYRRKLSLKVVPSAK